MYGRRGRKRPFRPFENDEEASPADKRNARDPYSAGPRYANSSEAGWVDEADAEYWERQEAPPPPPSDDSQPPAQDNQKTAADPHEEKYVQSLRTAPRTPSKPDGVSQPRAGGNPMGYVYSDGTDYDADHDDGVQVVKPTPSAQATPPYIRNPGTSNSNTIPKQPPSSAGSQEPRPRAGGPRKPPPRGGKAGWAVLGLVVLVVGGGIYWAATQGIQMATDTMDDVAGIITETVDVVAPDVERAIGTAVDTVSDAAEGMVGDPGSIADAVISMLPEAVGPYVLQVDDDAASLRTIQSPEQPTNTMPSGDDQPQTPLDRTIWPTSPTVVEPPQTPLDKKSAFIEQVENHVHTMTNGERASHGIRFLASDNRLDDIARNHSQDMADRGYFDHDTPEGLDPTDRGAAVGYNCRKDYGSYYTYGLAENIFTISWAGSNPEMLAHQIVDSWMGSPGHRQNILESDYDVLGVGIAVSRTGAVYATQNFC